MDLWRETPIDVRVSLLRQPEGNKSQRGQKYYWTQQKKGCFWIAPQLHPYVALVFPYCLTHLEFTGNLIAQ